MLTPPTPHAMIKVIKESAVTYFRIVLIKRPPNIEKQKTLNVVRETGVHREAQE
jgi:hypothetical protein